MQNRINGESPRAEKITPLPNQGVFNWVPRPRSADGWTKMDLVRHKPPGSMRFVCLSHEVLGAQVHYVASKHTTAHLQPSELCPGCKAGAKLEWAGHVCGWNPTTNRIVIVALTLGSMKFIEPYFLAHSTLRGAEMTLSRPNNKTNGPLRIDIIHSGRPLNQIPEAVDICPILWKMWDLDPEVARSHTSIQNAEFARALREAAPIPFVGQSTQPHVADSLLQPLAAALDAQRSHPTATAAELVHKQTVPQPNGRH